MRIIIEVTGGCVSAAFSDNKDLTVAILDYDVWKVETNPDMAEHFETLNREAKQLHQVY